MTETFPCGHPREPGNTTAKGHCRLCQHIHNICRKVERDQRKINEGRLYNRGERIARGLA